MRLNQRFTVHNSNNSELELRVAFGFDFPLSSWFIEFTLKPNDGKAFVYLRLWSQIRPRLSNLEFLEFLRLLGFTTNDEAKKIIEGDEIPDENQLELVPLIHLTVSEIARHVNAMFITRDYQALIQNRSIELSYKKLCELI